MAFKRKYKFSIIDHLYYAGRIRRIHNRWFMPLDAIFLWVFAVVPSLLIIRFLYWYLQLIIPQYFISNKSGIWSLSLIVHSKG